MNTLQQQQMMRWLPTLYFVKGLLHVLLFVVMLIMLRQLGMSVAETTASVALLYIPWVTKWLWKPYVEHSLTYRQWILITEMILVPFFGLLTFAITDVFATISLLLVIASLTAVHNVAVDELFRQSHLSDGAFGLFTIREVARKVADVLGIGLLVMLVGNLQVIYRYAQIYSWRVMAYCVSTVLFVLFFWHLLNLPHGSNTRSFKHKTSIGITECVYVAVFIFVPTIISKLSVLFLIENQSSYGLGLSPQEFGFAMGTLGVLGITFGMTFGMKMLKHYGIEKLILPFMLLMTIPSLIYTLLSFFAPYHLTIVYISVFVEQLAYGFGMSSYIVILKSLSNKEIGKSVMALAMMTGCALAGQLEYLMGFSNAFLLLMVLELLSLVASFLLFKRLVFHFRNH